MKILIVGCGWYGCHCASLLLKHGVEFHMIDMMDDFFMGSSSKNQNRLHLGFHYSRSYKTRKECMDGYKRFMDEYPQFTVSIPKNYYIVDRLSLVDYPTYCHIYRHEHVTFTRPAHMELEFDFNMELVDGFLKVDERFIDFKKAQAYFRETLSKYMLKYNAESLCVSEEKITYNGEEYDFMLDCTYSTQGDDMYYEKCVSLIYEYSGTDRFAVTVMDGPFFSIYPYDIDKNLYTLTDVEFTPTGTIEAKENMEQKVRKYIPDFDKIFTYKGHFISQKAKPKYVKSDDRSLMWKKQGKVLSLSGGKITGIFSMEQVLLKEILHEVS